MSTLGCFEKMRRYIKPFGLNLNTEFGLKDNIALWIFPLCLYVYSAMVLIRKWNFSDDFQDVLYGMGLVTAIPHITIPRIKRTTLANIMDSLENIEVPSGKGQEQLWSSLRRTAVTTVFTYLVTELIVISHPLKAKVTRPMGLLAIAAIVSVWIFTPERNRLPFSSMPESALNFSITGCFVFQVLMYCGHAHEYIMLDGLKFNILVQLRMHFQYLRLNVEDILAYHPPELARSEAWSSFQRRLKELVTYHCSLTTLVEKVEDVFNKRVLCSFVTLSFFVCFSLYSMSSIPLFGLQFWKFAGFIFFPCTLFFVDCYFAEEVLTESAALSYSCYNVEFIGADLRLQKALLMLMRRSQKGLMFTIGKFAPLSILTIVTVVKTSVSFFMFMKNMKNH